MISIGLIGYGRWGRHILRDLLTLGVRVHVADTLSISREAAVVEGASSACADYVQLPEVEGVVVATTTTSHAEIIEGLLPRGKPIFVEKPLSNDLADARRLSAAAPDRIFVMDKWRYHPGVEALAALVRTNVLGSIFAIHTHRLGWGRSQQDVDPTWILMPHDLSIAYEILGFLPNARSAVCYSPNKDTFNFIGVLQNQCNEVRVITEISTYHPVSRRSVVVVGSTGSAQLADSHDDRILVARHALDCDKGHIDEIAVSNQMPLLRELEAFVAHIRGGPPPRSSVAEGSLIVERIAALHSLAGLQ